VKSCFAAAKILADFTNSPPLVLIDISHLELHQKVDEVMLTIVNQSKLAQK